MFPSVPQIAIPSRYLTRFLFTLAILILAVNCQSAFPQSDSPNIVVVLCDDLGYGDLECYGHPHIKTPNLNRLAESGIRMTACYSAAPVCSPSRVGLLTGRSPNRAGVYDWIPPAGKQPKADHRDLVHMRDSEVTIPQLLKRAGYATCMSGKWHCNSQFNSDAQPQPGDAGFDHWFGTQNNAAPSHENPTNYVRNGEKVGPLEGFSCQIATSEAIDWIQRHSKENSQQPFFVYLAFHEPHEPVASPRELVETYSEVAATEDEAQFFANVANVDLAVGRLVTELEKLKLRENTLIIFTSDNGPETLNRYKNANRSYGRPGPLRGMKLWTTDAGFRVAGIASWPKSLAAGQVSDAAFSSLDFLPTFVSLAGGELPTDISFDGVDLSPAFNDEGVLGDFERPKPLLWCYYNAINEQRVAMRDGQWKMLARLNSGELPKMQNVFSGNREQIQSAELSDFELYDMSNDSAEANDVFGSASESDSLKNRMIEHYQDLVANSHVWDRE